MIGDEHGIEAGALMPLEIVLRIVASDRRPADVVRGAGVTVEVHRGKVGALTLQPQHRAVRQEPAADEQREQHHGAHQRAKLLAEHDSSPDGTRQTRQMTNSRPRPRRKPWSRLRLSMAAPSQSEYTGASTTYDGGALRRSPGGIARPVGSESGGAPATRAARSPSVSPSGARS